MFHQNIGVGKAKQRRCFKVGTSGRLESAWHSLVVRLARTPLPLAPDSPNNLPLLINNPFLLRNKVPLLINNMPLLGKDDNYFFLTREIVFPYYAAKMAKR